MNLNCLIKKNREMSRNVDEREDIYPGVTDTNTIK
jgi:hypothetical protein